ncbi:MAG: LptE family protein [Bacteroidales bacterium]|nr:LptE family protein [Tenuifilaceae bacterium]
MWRTFKRVICKKLVNIALAAIVSIAIMSCSVGYTFSGASIAPEVKTVSVGHFQNLAPLVNPMLSNTLAESLRNRFTTQTRLNSVAAYGDLSFTGEIRDYRVQPVAVQGNEIAAMNRLTISVRVKFENAIDPTQNYDKTFSHFEDFDSRQQLTQVEQNLVKIIVDKLIEDIFNNAVANW